MCAFLCLVLVAVIQVVIIIYVANRMLAPITAIKDNMLRFSQGDLDAKLWVAEDDSEIGQLAAAVNATKRRTGQIIGDISYMTGELASGDFTVRSQYEEDYIGSYRPILDSLNALEEQQRSTLSRIGDAATQVSSGSAMVSQGSSGLAEGASSQANSIEELSEAITRISTDIDTNARRVADATALVQRTGGAVNAANEKMTDMVNAMKRIGETSDQIANIIKTIDDIAFQTNILALNAAVEAARAGTAGKGFAVVADEVRSLASKSSEAAKTTADLISESTAAVHDGNLIANETASTLQGVVGNITEIVDTIQEIETASEQQATSVSQFASGVEQISGVVQENQANAEESAATSQELNRQAQMLKELVGQFHLT
jgi:methyl-accepting chemotaxis protein